VKLKLKFSAVTIAFLTMSFNAQSEIQEIHLTIKDHLFFPETLIVPINQKIKLIIDNQDKTPEEFDSFDLNREKVIFGYSRAVIYIGPLKKGQYTFFGEYAPQTAQGKIIARKKESQNAP